VNNPLIIPILAYLREKNSSCSLVDLVNLCDEDLLKLIGKNVEFQIVIFQKNFFVMNALYQIQNDIQTEGFSLTILPMDISMVPNYDKSKSTLTNRDTALANYYLNWSNLESITTEEVEALFNSFWQKYSAIDKVDMALTSLGLEQGADWFDVRQAYKKRIAINHPDKGGCAERFIEIREAYEVLSFSYRKS
jgi:hypothetical protein